MQDIKQKAKVNYVDRETCEKQYPTRVIDEKHICAGGNDGIDSCKGTTKKKYIKQARFLNRLFIHI